MHLLDINVWLALAFEVHAHHRRAKKWFQGAGPDSCAFCWLTQQGFLKIFNFHRFDVIRQLKSENPGVKV